MLKLQEISKYYARNGQVALGLRKLNLEFKLGEFVAIVGESGSGKSTLLNVLSGIDSYEEGELLINEQQTSHYTEKDWENYRKHYIGFVFQNYNIIESFTVYQNVEAALLVAGFTAAERKVKALELIKRVGLERYAHTKASKLSGGQMQRTAIARALAKDCPIIIADEPTGNLDSESSKQMIQLLAEIAQDKLVIMVTHNIEEVEHTITRKITLHDGHIVDDQQLRHSPVDASASFASLDSSTTSSNISDLMKLSLKFVTATPIKSLLIFTVLIMLCLGSAFIYGNMLAMKSFFDQNPQNMYFPNSSERRIVVHQADRSTITGDEVAKLQAIHGVQEWISGDVALDSNILVELPKLKSKDPLKVTAAISPWSLIEEERLIAGQLPQHSDEIVLNTQALRKGYQAVDLLNKEITISNDHQSYQVKIVGIADYSKIGEMIFLPTELINQLADYALTSLGMTYFTLEPLEKTPFIPIEAEKSESHNKSEVQLNYAAFQQYCASAGIVIEQCQEQIIGKPISIEVVNGFTTVKHDFTVSNIVESDMEAAEAGIYFSVEALAKLNSQAEPYQGSIIVSKDGDPQFIMQQVKEQGYKAIYPYETVVGKSPLAVALELLVLVGFIAIFIGIFFFIAYFILKTMMRSKQKDYIILRSIGASSSFIHRTMFLELISLSTLAYVVSLLSVKLVQLLPSVKSISLLANLYRSYAWYDYMMMYVIVFLLTLLLVNRIKKQLATGSVLTILKGE